MAKYDSDGGLEMMRNSEEPAQRRKTHSEWSQKKNVTALPAPAKPEDSFLSSNTPP